MGRTWLERLRLWALVRRVALLRQLDGAVVGPKARQGDFHRLMAMALREGTEADFRQWLVDPHTQVRALGVVCLVQRRPEDLFASLQPLGRDVAMVKLRPHGEAVFEMPLSQLAMVLINTPGYFGSRTSSPQVS